MLRRSLIFRNGSVYRLPRPLSPQNFSQSPPVAPVYQGPVFPYVDGGMQGDFSNFRIMPGTNQNSNFTANRRFNFRSY